MRVKRTVEREDGSVVFQGILEGAELAYVIEVGLDTLIESGHPIFASTETHAIHDLHELPEGKQ